MWNSPVMPFMHGMNATATTFYSTINLHLKHLTVLWTAAMFAMFCNNWKRKIKYTAQSHSGKTGGFSCCERGGRQGKPPFKKQQHLNWWQYHTFALCFQNKWTEKNVSANFLIGRDGRRNFEIERGPKIGKRKKAKMVTILSKDPFELVEDIGDLTFEHVKGHLCVR